MTEAALPVVEDVYEGSALKSRVVKHKNGNKQTYNAPSISPTPDATSAFTRPSFSIPTHGNTGNAKLWQRVLALEFILAFGVHWVREFLDPDSDANTRGVADIDRTLSIMAVYFVLAVAAQGKLAKGSAALGGIICANILFTHRDFLTGVGRAVNGGIAANPEADNSANQTEFGQDVESAFGGAETVGKTAVKAATTPTKKRSETQIAESGAAAAASNDAGGVS